MKPFVVPITCVILPGCSCCSGTGPPGRAGSRPSWSSVPDHRRPGAFHLAKNPAVLWAIHLCAGLFFKNQVRGFEVLGGGTSP